MNTTQQITDLDALSANLIKKLIQDEKYNEDYNKWINGVNYITGRKIQIGNGVHKNIGQKFHILLKYVNGSEQIVSFQDILAIDKQITEQIAEHTQRYRKVLMDRIIKDPSVVLEYPEADSEMIRVAIKLDGNLIKHYAKYRADYDTVLEAVQNNGCAIEYCPLFQKNREIVLAAVKQNGLAIQYCPRFHDDREIILAAVEQDGRAIQYCPLFQKDREFILAAVTQNGETIQYCQHFQGDREIVLAAVKQDGHAISYCPEFQNDREIELASIRQLYDARSLKSIVEQGAFTDSKYLMLRNMNIQWLSQDPWHRCEIFTLPRDINFRW